LFQTNDVIVYSLNYRKLKEITVMCRLTTGIRSEKCVVRWFYHRANIIECTYTSLVYMVYGIAYCS